ncbi:MAG: hypothetical protein WAZ18_04490 [Alphaproteobacteria bacterium]
MASHYEQTVDFDLMVKTATALSEAGFNTYSLTRSNPAKASNFSMSGGFIVSKGENPKKFMYVYADNFGKNEVSERHWVGSENHAGIATLNPWYPVFKTENVVDLAEKLLHTEAATLTLA